MNATRRRVVTADAAATEALGAALARTFSAEASRALVVGLRGDLGAGKTTLVRGLLHALGVEGAVRSPTFSLLEEYQTPSVRVLHLDLYRLARADDLAALGLADFDEAGSLWLIEWPERGLGQLGPMDLELRLEGTAVGHTIELCALSEAGRRWLARLDSAPLGT